MAEEEMVPLLTVHAMGKTQWITGSYTNWADTHQWEKSSFNLVYS